MPVASCEINSLKLENYFIRLCNTSMVSCRRCPTVYANYGKDILKLMLVKITTFIPKKVQDHTFHTKWPLFFVVVFFFICLTLLHSEWPKLHRSFYVIKS